ncbi:MAG: heterodisulfide reductase-related iron-sulfur binding cluster [Bacteroidota bacterium]|nr:heterodisulfide reductase-related iron-sulfur binding cluster [Bacteroidota bacterium]
MERIIFLITMIITFGILTYSLTKVIKLMKSLKPFKIDEIGKRLTKMLKIAFGQTKILKRPVIGLMHALVFWGFLVILFGSLEMMYDGLAGTERAFGSLGGVYDFIIATGDIFALIIGIFVFIFILRRTIIHIPRFEGVEMTKKSHLDALFALTLIFILMISLMGINLFYFLGIEKTGEELVGIYPVAKQLAVLFPDISVESAHLWFKINWWTHILTIFFFANFLPYSKHFHVYMSIPNVFLSRLESLGKMDTMYQIKSEIKAMMNPEAPVEETSEETEIERFGVLDVTDITWKSYMDSLACTQCGRCTSVCPANLTGKLLSPRKIIMNVRDRMKEIAPAILKGEKEINDGKALIADYISEEELWACTSCNACANECPISINHPSLILDMRRYLVMEKSSAPSGLNTVFQNIENNGAPWQFNYQDRLIWAENIELNGKKITVPTMADKKAKNENPDFLLWVGSAGAFDDRYKKVMQNFVKILHHLNINYAVLGTEESDSGDVARRAGNEMLFQMQTMQNIEIFNTYNVKKIVTCDPHDFNTFLHEYPDFEGNFEVVHHTQFLQDLINKDILNLKGEKFKGKKVTFHDPCYLGRINDEVDAPRFVIKELQTDMIEMENSGKDSLCCGAGGGQMFKEAEKGDKEVFIERTEEAIDINAEIIVSACPFCMTMLTDGIKYTNQEENMKNYDIAELIAMDLEL